MEGDFCCRFAGIQIWFVLNQLLVCRGSDAGSRSCFGYGWLDLFASGVLDGLFLGLLPLVPCSVLIAVLGAMFTFDPGEGFVTSKVLVQPCNLEIVCTMFEFWGLLVGFAGGILLHFLGFCGGLRNLFSNVAKLGLSVFDIVHWLRMYYLFKKFMVCLWCFCVMSFLENRGRVGAFLHAKVASGGKSSGSFLKFLICQSGLKSYLMEEVIFSKVGDRVWLVTSCSWNMFSVIHSLNYLKTGITLVWLMKVLL